MRPFLLALMLTVPMPAMASGYFLKLVSVEGQYTRIDNGLRSVDVQTPGSVVRLVETSGADKKLIRFLVFSLNTSTAPFEIGPENVKVELAGGPMYPMVTYEEMVRREERHEKRQRFAMALAAAGRSMSAAGAGYSSGTATYNGNVYGAYGSANYMGTANYETYDPARAQAAQAIANSENARDIAAMRQRQAMSMAALDFYLKTSTVDPQKVQGGPVLFDLPQEIKSAKDDYPVTIIVTIAGEEHRFGAIVRRMK